MSDAVASGVEDLERRIGHRFADRHLLETALVHASRAAEEGTGRGNERLEYLGDAVVGLAVAHLLYETHPDWDEGALSRARAALVNRAALASRARALELGRFVRLGRTEQQSGGEDKDRVLANCFEALVGAVHLDGGLAPALSLVRESFGDAIERGPVNDAKTEFQELAHAQERATPRYFTIEDNGIEGDANRFTVEVRVDDEAWGRGVGRSKRVAEQAAAAAAMQRGTDV